MLFSRADLRESMVFYDFLSRPMFAWMFSLLVYLRGQCRAPVLFIYREPVNMGKPESLRNNFGIWDFNERHNKHICVPADAGKVN